MAGRREFGIATDIFLRDPASPWQCVSTEDTQGLPPQYFSTDTDLSKHDRHGDQKARIGRAET